MRTPNEIVADALIAIHASPDLPALEQVKAGYLGKSGQLTELLKSLGAMPAEQRKTAGARINEAKQAVEAALKTRRDALQQRRAGSPAGRRNAGRDPAGTGVGRGGLHPVSRTLARIQALFRSIGFEVADGPEIETTSTTSPRSNIPEDHPARAMHDTFYLARAASVCCARTPRRCRCGTCRPTSRRCASSRPAASTAAIRDATHTPMFHQVEGLWVDERRQLRRPQGRARRLHAQTSSSATTCRCASARRSFRSPNRRPRSTSAA